jgi:hypothetical protein
VAFIQISVIATMGDSTWDVCDAATLVSVIPQ